MIENAPTESLENRWQDAHANDDLDAMIEILYEAIDSETMPGWLNEERRKLCDSVGSQVYDTIDDDDTQLGYQAIRLSGTGESEYLLRFLGIASVGIQKVERGGEVNRQLVSLLESNRAAFDSISHGLPTFVLNAVELATRRVAILVRLSCLRKIEAMESRYIDALETAELVSVPEIRMDAQRGIYADMRELQEHRDEFAKWLTMIEHEGERQNISECLEWIDKLIDAGNRAVGCR